MKSKDDIKLADYQAMIEKSIDGFFITDSAGKIIYTNSAYLKITGLRREDAEGNTVYKMLEDGIMSESSVARTIESGETVSTMNQYYSGKRCLVSCSPVFETDGQLKLTISLVRDLSALDQLQKKLDNEKMHVHEMEAQLLAQQNEKKPSSFTTKSRALEKIMLQIESVKDTDSTVLITGETGTGKDYLANYIHDTSKRKDTGRLIKINCGAIPENLLESELFGYEGGAFTGAKKGGNPGLLELAHNGTLFIDEVGDMSYHLQVKLLNAIQDKSVYRLGGNKPVSFDARIIAATNADLEQLVVEKKFRADLYYRLNVINIKMPALRQRKEDIIPLALSFLDEFNKRHSRARRFDAKVLSSLLLYDWPGNIRELRNAVERMVVISPDDLIGKEIFVELILGDNAKASLQPDADDVFSSEGKTLAQQMENFEKQLIKGALDNNKTLREAAQNLGIDISTLVRKKKKYEV